MTRLRKTSTACSSVLASAENACEASSTSVAARLVSLMALVTTAMLPASSPAPWAACWTLLAIISVDLACCLDRAGDRGREVVDIAHHPGDRTDGLDRVAGGVLDGADLLGDIFRGARGLTCQRLDLRGHHGKAAAGFARARRLNGGVERQEVGLFRDIPDQHDDVADPVGADRQLPDQSVGRPRDLGGAVNDAMRFRRLCVDFANGLAELIGGASDGLDVGRGRLGRQRRRARLLVGLVGDRRQCFGRCLHARDVVGDGADDAGDGAAKVADDLVDGGGMLVFRGLGRVLTVRVTAAFDLAVAEHFECASHLADFVAVGGGGNLEVDVAGGEAAHGAADRDQAPHQTALDVEDADAAGREQAGERHDQQQGTAAVEACRQRFGAALHAGFGLADERCDGIVEFTQDRDVLVDGGVDPGDGEQLAGPPREHAVDAETEAGDLAGCRLHLALREGFGALVERFDGALEAILDRFECRQGPSRSSLR